MSVVMASLGSNINAVRGGVQCRAANEHETTDIYRRRPDDFILQPQFTSTMTEQLI